MGRVCFWVKIIVQRVGIVPFLRVLNKNGFTMYCWKS